MARQARSKPKGIALRGTIYHARLTIPKDVRDTIGMIEFTQSLETSDLKVAAARGEACIRDWKRQISDARGTQSPISEAILWKAEFDKSNEKHLSNWTSPSITDTPRPHFEAISNCSGLTPPR